MTDLEFQDWLEAEVQNGRMTIEQRDDLLEQKRYFDADRAEIQRQFAHQVVGYVGGTRKVAATVQELLAQTQRSYPSRMVYFEPIGFEAANGSTAPDEAMLVQVAQTRLPAAAERRLRRLIGRSERGQLTPQELAEYQALAQETQRIDAARAEALAQLARRQGRSVQAVKAVLDREGSTDGA